MTKNIRLAKKRIIWLFVRMIFMIFLLWKRVFLKSCMKYFSIIEKDILEEEHGSSIAESDKEISRS